VFSRCHLPFVTLRAEAFFKAGVSGDEIRTSRANMHIHFTAAAWRRQALTVCLRRNVHAAGLLINEWHRTYANVSSLAHCSTAAWRNSKSGRGAASLGARCQGRRQTLFEAELRTLDMTMFLFASRSKVSAEYA
jgi:hypothetical protein